jgi:hypothetical protein
MIRAVDEQCHPTNRVHKPKAAYLRFKINEFIQRTMAKFLSNTIPS